MGAELAAVLACLLGSAFFSSAETALTSLPITRLEGLTKQGPPLLRAGFSSWAKNPQRLLVTILIGNNLVNVLASVLATQLSYHISSSAGISLVVGVMTLAILIVGEITPKSLAQVYAEPLSTIVIGPLYLLDKILTPISIVLISITRLLTRDRRAEAPVTETDLLAMLRLAQHHEHLVKSERKMMESVLRVHDTFAHEVMVPRPRVISVSPEMSADEVKEVVTSSGHTRLPVLDEDEILGVLHAKNLLHLGSGESWLELPRSPFFIPEGKPLGELLDRMRHDHEHMALILDEYGVLAGIVTIEDILEMVVGDIRDEHDEQLTEIVERDGAFVVAGHLSIRRLERTLDCTIDTPERIDTVGGLLDSHLDEDGVIGDRVELAGFALEILEMADDLPSRVRVTRLATT